MTEVRPKIAPSLMTGESQGQSDGIDSHSNRIGHVQLVKGHDAGDDDADKHIEKRAEPKGSEDADRHVTLRVLGFLRGGRDRVETDICEEHNGSAAQDPAPAENAGPLVWRNERALRIACRHPIVRIDERVTLITTMTLLTLVDSWDANDEKRRDRRDNEHGRNVEEGTGTVPDATCGVIG